MKFARVFVFFAELYRVYISGTTIVSYSFRSNALVASLCLSVMRSIVHVGDRSIRSCQASLRVLGVLLSIRSRCFRVYPIWGGLGRGFYAHFVLGCFLRRVVIRRSRSPRALWVFFVLPIGVWFFYDVLYRDVASFFFHVFLFFHLFVASWRDFFSCADSVFLLVRLRWLGGLRHVYGPWWVRLRPFPAICVIFRWAGFHRDFYLYVVRVRYFHSPVTINGRVWR